MKLCAELCAQLYKAIVHQEWDKARELVAKLKSILDTYKDAC